MTKKRLSGVGRWRFFIFLDEVHRLTSEGQEKNCLQFLDKGYFTRMGEAEKQRNVSIKFIFLQQPKQSINIFLKNVFLRRIPVTLAIPAFSRALFERKIQLIFVLFFLEESQRIQKEYPYSL